MIYLIEHSRKTNWPVVCPFVRLLLLRNEMNLSPACSESFQFINIGQWSKPLLLIYKTLKFLKSWIASLFRRAWSSCLHVHPFLHVKWSPMNPTSCKQQLKIIYPNSCNSSFCTIEPCTFWCNWLSLSLRILRIWI